MKTNLKDIAVKSLLGNHCLGAMLLFLYFFVFGISVNKILSGLEYCYFLSSLAFAALTFYMRDPDLTEKKVKNNILFSQVTGSILVFAYLLIYGISSVAILEGFKLVFFMSSYVFAMSIFYIRDQERIKKAEEELSVSITTAYIEKNPCFINKEDLSWLVRKVNSGLAVIIGFSELLLQRKYSEVEKEYMIRNIYEQGIEISSVVNKASDSISDSTTKPKEIYEVADMLSDNNFK